MDVTAVSAHIDLTPGSEPTLHVTVDCTAAHPGYEVSLSRQDPQGANPRDLLLNLVANELSGNFPQIITPFQASYSERVEGEDFDTVSILPGGPAGTPVQITS